MALTANNIIERAASIYNDTSFDRVSNVITDNPNWFQFLDDALKQLVLVRPDSYCTTTTLQLITGTKQSVPSAGMRLLDITRNMGSDGLTPGVPITYVDRNILDMSLLAWHTSTGQAYIDSYWFDTDNPTVFYVTPPSLGTNYIELTYSRVHAAITTTTDSIDVKDIFLNPLLSWTLYRAFLIDTDSQFNWNRAQHFSQDFYMSLGLDDKVKELTSPSSPTKGRGM